MSDRLSIMRKLRRLTFRKDFISFRSALLPH